MNQEFTKTIGMFDSGVGGLTLVSEAQRQLPREKVIYFGDTANVPYGDKSTSQLIGLADSAVRFLIQRGVKVIVDACNSTSSVALDFLKETHDVPIVGVINAGVQEAVDKTENGRIGVIATSATIESGAHEKEAGKIAPSVKVFGQACPRFVPLIEEGRTNSLEAHRAAHEYLKPLQEKGIDTLILGCTHFPFISHVLEGVLGPSVQLVNPAVGTILQLKNLLEGEGMLNKSEERRNFELRDHEYYVSGDPEAFKEAAEKLLNTSLGLVYQIAIKGGETGEVVR
ncbi:MAG: glutamate racemase [Clostridia bacterium]|nr:glutamate racemase [Clostridia bacterium]